ncbi:hypothetical protein LTR28_012049 [Elasticomyces elasticus]|nr:hypothetical protein LTR28_012049 [Elasticomyces elasticus]
MADRNRTGESPWVKEIIEKYHDVAKKNHAILIPQTGIESAPADLLTWALVSHIRQTLDRPTRRVTLTVHDMKAAPSGGTLATVLGLFDRYSAKEVADSMKPHAMDAVMNGVGKGQQRGLGARRRKGWVERVFGVRTVPGLGTLTTSLQGGPDTPIIYRSRSLLTTPSTTTTTYGPNFTFEPYATARNALLGALTHLTLTLGTLALLLLPTPLRRLLSHFIYAPGQGPSRASTRSDRIEWRAIAVADTGADGDGGVDAEGDPKRAWASMRWEGSMYALTGVLVAEAARVIVRGGTMAAREVGGGVLTPAMLGAPFLEALKGAGVRVEVRTMP